MTSFCRRAVPSNKLFQGVGVRNPKGQCCHDAPDYLVVQIVRFCLERPPASFLFESKDSGHCLSVFVYSQRPPGKIFHRRPSVYFEFKSNQRTSCEIDLAAAPQWCRRSSANWAKTALDIALDGLMLPSSTGTRFWSIGRFGIQDINGRTIIASSEMSCHFA